MIKRLLLLVSSLLLLFSCGYREGVVQRAEKSFLSFSGNTEGALVQIDDLKPFAVNSVNISNEPQKISVPIRLYQISPGKHRLKVFRGEDLIVDRILTLDNQTTMEVMIP